MKKNYLFWVAFVVTVFLNAQTIFINEIHYDNVGGDSNEGIEIAGPYSTDLTGYSIVLYNGNGSSVYDTINLTGSIPNNENYMGTLWFPQTGIQNGSPDGLALVDDYGMVIQFLSYEGVITAVNGPAIGMTSIDIGVNEISTNLTNYSLQLTGLGTEYNDFTWSNPIAATENLKNTGQDFLVTPFIVRNGIIPNLNYEVNSGPSLPENFSVSGYNLTSDILITAPTNFEISTSSLSGFGSSITLLEGVGSVFPTTIYVRLVDNLSVNSYLGNITIASLDADSKIFNVFGSVFTPLSLVITGIIDGPLVGGTPKAIELYAINDIPDLSIYGIGIVINGEGTGGIEYSFPEESINAGSYLYFTNGAVNFTDFFGFSPNYSSISMSVNGDDAIELFENGGIIDVFGDVNTDGTGEAWDYQNGWAYRSAAGPNNIFSASDWYYSGINALDNEITNSGATTPFPIGTYHLTLAIVKNQIEGFLLYPNPVTKGSLVITSSSKTNKQVEIYSMLGKRVYSKTIESNGTLDISNLRANIYMVKVNEEGKIATRKLIIK